MKQKILAIAALGFAAGASAQSSVTVFGFVDMGIVRATGSIADRTQLSSNGISVSQIGFRGVEDLGGDLKAGFWLEAGLFPDSGIGAASNTNNQTTGAAPAAAGGARHHL